MSDKYLKIFTRVLCKQPAYAFAVYEIIDMNTCTIQSIKQPLYSANIHAQTTAINAAIKHNID